MPVSLVYLFTDQMVTVMPVTVSVMIPLISKLLPGQFHVIGPREPVIALVGEEAVLSCQLSPSMDAQNMEVRWYRNVPLDLVHRYSTSQDDTEEQMLEYQGRTEFLKDNITKGHVALRIHQIQLSDGGEYACYFESSTYYNEAKFQVLVTVSGMAPHICIETGNRREIKLTCTSTGWYPKPELQWRDHQGLHLTPVSETKTMEENGLFHVESSVTVDKSSREKVSCIVRNLILNVEKDVHVSIADVFLLEDFTWIVWLIIILCLLAIGATISVLLVRARKSKVLEVRKSKVEAPAGLVSENPLSGLEFARRFAENVTLDPDTAHPYLQIAEDNKSVKGGVILQDLPKSTQRFDNLVCVLGQQMFSEGKHSWEVSVNNKMEWTLGICKDSVCRQGEITVSPETGFWTLCLNKSNDYQAVANPPVVLHVEKPPKIIGIFLDYEAGKVSFYNVTTRSHIYTYKECFTEALRPYFYPGPLYNGQNGNPLTILPFSHLDKPGRRFLCD
ncbi:butyrophilin subfamily 1 member A1-like [Ursus maritimus]|uniref:Butyrophilin subfamily 1 member A1-like n=1 Tax=Ursus maritimus TaxID=29073 RepID=A0A8M1F9W5_URSMA|nr:butyrophilin subfamily 1 member A1-like [Ursus maritimus]